MYLPPFDIHILGTSSAVPAFNRYPSAQLIHINGTFLLIDCGEGTQMQLRKYQLPLTRIDFILISHLHGDHIFGLPGLLTSMSLLQRQKELTIITPPALQEIIKHTFYHCEAKVKYPLKFIFTQSNNIQTIIENEKFKITTVPLIHRIPTTGFVIEEQELSKKIIKEKIKEYQISVHQFHRLKKGMDVEDEYGNIIKNEWLTQAPPKPRKYVYFSDTAPLPQTPEVTKYADILYHEATFLKEHQQLAQLTMHSSVTEAANMAIQMNTKKLVIGHYSARYENIELLLHEAKSIFENTELAIEGKKITL